MNNLLFDTPLPLPAYFNSHRAQRYVIYAQHRLWDIDNTDYTNLDNLHGRGKQTHSTGQNDRRMSVALIINISSLSSLQGLGVSPVPTSAVNFIFADAC
jgi:hypothetical protein